VRSRSILASLVAPLGAAALLSPPLAGALPATIHLTATVHAGRCTGGVCPSRETVFEGTTRVGEDSSRCTQISKIQFHCVGSYALRRGTITFAGTTGISNSNRLAISGGTGAYRGVRGTVLTEFNKAGTKAKETLTFRQ
jgi:hypothetical protein